MNDIFGKSHISPNLNGTAVISIEVDQVNPNNVVVTSKTDIKIYDPDNRRVINSWYGKSWLMPSSSCVNDSNNQFYCPLLNSSIMTWSSSESDIDNIKPVKISSPIFRLFPHDGKVYVIFKFGFVEPVTSVLKNRKKKRSVLIPEGTTIVDCYIQNDRVLIATSRNISSSKRPDQIHIYPIGACSKDSVSSYDISRPGLSLIGYCFTSWNSIISVWSNGDVCLGLLSKDHLSESVGSTLPLKLQSNCSTNVSCDNPIKLVQVTSRHFAIIGKALDKDGGCISLWDMDLFVEVSSRGFKVYSSPLKAYGLMVPKETYGGGILLVEGVHITTVPVIKIPPEGILQFLQEDSKLETKMKSVEYKNWNLRLTSKHQTPRTPSSKSQGTPKRRKSGSLERMVEENGLSTVDEVECIKSLTDFAVEKNNHQLVVEILLKYKNVPEESKVKLLTFILASEEGDFSALVTSRRNGITKPPNGVLQDTPRSKKKRSRRSSMSERDFKHTNGGVEEPMETDSPHKKDLKSSVATSSGKDAAIHLILAKSVMEATLLVELKKLNFRDAIEISDKLCQLLTSKVLDGDYTDGSLGDAHSEPSTAQALTWLTLLMDAHFSGLKLEQQLNTQSVCTQEKMALCDQLMDYFSLQCSNSSLSKMLLTSVPDVDQTSLFIGDRCNYSECKYITY